MPERDVSMLLMAAASFQGLSPKTRWVLLAGAAAVLFCPLAVLLNRRTAVPRIVGPVQSCVALASSKAASFQELINCSQLLLDQHHEMQSLPLLQRAAALQPQSAIVHNNLCVAYGLLQDRERAVQECTTATALNPAFELARNNLRWVTRIGAGGAE